jgi:ubiquinone biosynthesis protein UbiJ
MSVNTALIATLESLLNRAIHLDPETPARLVPLHGKAIQMELLGVGSSLYFFPDPSGIQILSDYEAEADCTLRGSPLDLMGMGNTRQSADQLFQGRVSIEGDTALAQAFGALLTDLEIDWEEQLSRITGDIAAHQIGNLVRSALNWGHSVSETAEQNLKEYLQEELRLLPGHNELAPFLEEVDRLRDDTERLEARFVRLKQRLEDKDKAK